MSVNAINSVDSANAGQKKNNTVAITAGSTLGLGAAGVGSAYLWGGKRPSLEEVFKMEPDTFDAKVKDTEGEVKEAADKIKAEITKLNEGEYAVDPGAKTAFDEAVERFSLADDALEVKAVTDAETAYNTQLAEKSTDADVIKKADDALKDTPEAKALRTAEENYNKKLLEELNNGRTDADKLTEISQAGEDELLKAKNAIANSDEMTKLKAAQNAYEPILNKEIDKVATEALKDSPQAKALTEAQEALRSAKEAGLRSDDAQKAVVKAYDDAVKAAGEKKSTKIGELVNNEEFKSAFGKVKKLFHEGQGKAALLWGCIAAAAGLILGLVLSSSGKKEA